MTTMKTTSSPSSSTPLKATVNEYQSIPARSAGEADAASSCSSLKAALLVVQRLVAARAEDRLAQPLEPEDEQERADEEAEGVDRDQPKRRPEHRDDHREHERRHADADQRRAPAAHDADREHDRQRLDRLDAAGEERREEEEDAVAHGQRSYRGAAGLEWPAMSDENLFGEEHVRRYRETGGEVGHIWRNGSKILLLTTKGRVTGELHTVPLIYEDSDGDCVIVASKGGAPEHPGWYRNLAKDPRVEVQVKGDIFPAHARTATGEERERLWKLAALQWPAYDDYAKKTDREIPVVVLEPLTD